MVAEKVKTQDFTEAESRRVALRAILKGDLRGKGAIVIFAAILEAHDEENVQLRAAVKYAGEALKILKGQFQEFRALVCKAAWALETLSQTTDFSDDWAYPIPGLVNHFHGLFTEEQHDALAGLAALDTSGYAPQCAGPAPEGGEYRVEGTGIGAGNPPRYEPRPGAMHRGSAGLPSIGRGKHS